jgi:glycogen(starch) synthase
MRILMWCDAFWPEIGGLEVFCMRLSAAFKTRGHECLIITDRNYPGNDGLSWYEGMPVHGFHFSEKRRMYDLAAMRRDHLECSRIIHDFNPDIIHLNAVSKTLLNFILLQREKKRPAVLTLHEPSLFVDTSKILLSTFENVGRLVAISESVKKTVLLNFPHILEKTTTILNALPEPPVNPTPLPGNQKILGFGRLAHSKGFDVAIRAFARIADLFPEATLTIAGDGIERAALEKQAGETGYGSRIHFLGWVNPDGIPALINDYRMVVMPSRWQEPFGLVALQAAQMGRPLVASAAGGIPEIVVDNVTGKLFENENDLEMAHAITLILRDPLLAEKMGTCAQEHARKHFDFDTFVKSYENILSNVLGALPV